MSIDRLKGPFDLFRTTGRVRRGEYLVIGLVLAIAKYGLDLALSTAYGHPFNPLMYFSPRVSPFVTSSDRAYLASLALAALPFVWVGVALSARRLRDAGLSPFWAGLFFMPFVRYAFFAAMVLMPEATVAPAAPEGGPFREGPAVPELPPPRLLAVMVPRNRAGAYALALLLSALVGVVGYIVTVQVDKSFGTVFFCGMPFGIGLFVAFMTSYHSAQSGTQAVLNGIWVHFVLLLVLCAFALEGVACIVMVFPLVAGMSALGGLVGHALARSRSGAVVATLVLCALPTLLGVDLARGHVPIHTSVVSSVVVNAPIEVVWKNVVSFPPIDEPPDAIFALVSMPIEARIEGTGPGAVRRCIFTSGLFEAFEEPVSVWRAPYELSFNVRAQPKSIDGYIDVERGQFRLRDNGDGTTTLDGETWYAMKLAPYDYFHAWGQVLLHHIHLRVLRHIKRISEHPEVAGAGEHGVLPQWMATSHSTCNCTRSEANTTR